MLKRIFDIVVALCLLVLLAPVMLVVAVVVRLVDGSPVLFRQVRPGLGGVPFGLCKFRTMSEARDPRGELMADGARLTPLGAFLRRASLDELPQLFNVLRGDMSLVGPRPLLMEYLPLYSPEQARRHAVRPGITGWAQVNGRNAIGWPERLALDVWYVDHQSVILDLRILAMTVGRVLGGRGVSAAGEATVSRFTGNDHDPVR